MHGGAKHFEETANLWLEGGLRIGAVPLLDYTLVVTPIHSWITLS